jgi:hypothetical protein
MNDNHPVQQVLELACAAQRLNKNYVKETVPVYSEDGRIMTYVWANKMLVLFMLYPENYKKTSPEDMPPPLLRITPEDVAQADVIQKYFRRLMFSAVQGENEFQTKVNSLLETGTVKVNEFGYIACLPSFYQRDHAHTQIKKRSRSVEDVYLAEISAWVTDKDCEIMGCQRSKNFDAWNIDAIIDNKMVSWMSKVDLKIGPAVIVKAKVKDHTKHWKYENSVTRLHYVKAVQ